LSDCPHGSLLHTPFWGVDVVYQVKTSTHTAPLRNFHLKDSLFNKPHFTKGTQLFPTFPE
jgi:hypothetical protein